jgi:acyl carrier protein
MIDTVARIAQIFRETLGIDVPSPTTDIIDSGLLDSLAFVTLLFELEQQFSIRIGADQLEIETLRTLQSIASMVDCLALAA